MSIEITGAWDKGFAFDVHTLSSTYLGPDETGRDRFDNVHSEMGELVYKLKYGQDLSVLARIVALLDKIKGLENFDVIMPIPPTEKDRAFQPVAEIARALGRHRGVEVRTDVLAKRPGGSQLKNVEDTLERIKLLQASIYIDRAGNVTGKRVLLIDDVYRSGATLAVATAALREAGARYVGVLTMTKTRTKR
jgi:competence protein ComFC